MSGASSRNRGRRFQSLIRDYLRGSLSVIEEGGSGLGGGDLLVRTAWRDVACEVKCQARMDLPGWHRQAQGNARGVEVPAVIHKRSGVAEAGEQWVTLTLEDFVALMEALG